jgi:hypothetical protein
MLRLRDDTRGPKDGRHGRLPPNRRDEAATERAVLPAERRSVKIMNGFHRNCAWEIDRGYAADELTDQNACENPSQLDEHRQDARVDARNLLDGRVEAARITNNNSIDDDYNDRWEMWARGTSDCRRSSLESGTRRRQRAVAPSRDRRSSIVR